MALEVPTAKAPCFRRKRYHPSPAIRPRRWSPVRTGELLVTLTVMSPENMAAFVRSWGADVKVLHSPALAAHIQGAAQEMLRMGPEAGA